MSETKRLFNIYGPNRGTGCAGNVWDIEHLSPTLTTMGGNREPIILTDMENIKKSGELQGKKLRIRKLTPKECFRLMGVDDVDIDKMQASGLSNSAQYKLAGNSIVVDVLYHIFRKMFVETDRDTFKGEAEQLTLF